MPEAQGGMILSVINSQVLVLRLLIIIILSLVVEMKVAITATMNMDFVRTLEMNMDFGGNLAGLVPKDILDQVFQIC